MSGVRDFSSTPRRRPPGGVELLALAVGLLAAAASVSSAWQAGSQLGRARAAVSRAQAELAEARQRGRGGPSSARLDATLASRVLLSRVASPAQVVGELSALLPPRVRLDALHLRYGDRLQLELRVRARGPHEYDSFLQQLRASGLFSEILPGSEARGEELSASVRLVRREDVAP